MAYTSTVRAHHPDGTPCRRFRVVLGLSGGNTGEFNTDDHGQAQVTHSSAGRATVYVSGKNVGEFQAPGSVTVTYR